MIFKKALTAFEQVIECTDSKTIKNNFRKIENIKKNMDNFERKLQS